MRFRPLATHQGTPTYRRKGRRARFGHQKEKRTQGRAPSPGKLSRQALIDLDCLKIAFQLIINS